MVVWRCLFGRHQRVRGEVRQSGKRFVSVCALCGKPIEKPLDRSRDWRLQKKR